MTYRPHYLFRVEGVFRDNTTDLETWSFGVRLAMFDNGAAVNAGFDDVDEMTWLRDQAEPAVRTLFGANTLMLPTTVTALKMNLINENGKYANEADTFALYESDLTAPIKGNTASRVEPQRTIAVTTTTDAIRGRAHRGRFYLPGFAINVANDLRITTVQAQGIADSAAAFLAALDRPENTKGWVLAPAVVSNIGVPGQIRRITGVRVGRVVDTQRRRRFSLDEAPSSAAVV